MDFGILLSWEFLIMWAISILGILAHKGKKWVYKEPIKASYFWKPERRLDTGATVLTSGVFVLAAMQMGADLDKIYTLAGLPALGPIVAAIGCGWIADSVIKLAPEDAGGQE